MGCSPVSDPTAEEELGELAGHLNVANARLTHVCADLLATGEWQRGGMRSPAAYLAWRMGLSPERAKLVVRVAERRSDFPSIIGAFDRGELSLEQVAEAVRAPAWADADIAHFVHISTVSKIRRAMRSDMFVGDPDEPEAATPPPRDRLSFGVRPDGRWRISGELGIDDGRRIEAALAERRDDLFSGGDEAVTWPEAFVDCFDRSLAAVGSTSRRDHFRTWLHLDVTDGETTTTDGWRIPMAIRDRLLCDGVVQQVWRRDGVPFSVGRTQRIVPDRTRRIVECRDRGCRVPGCDADQFVEIHHIVHWLDGGATDTPNLVSLCPGHHKVHHQGGLGIRGDADAFDGLVFTDDHGAVIAGSGTPTLPNAPPPAPEQPYQPPLNGRFDWNWIGLGWVHPNELERRRDRCRALGRARIEAA